YVFAWAPVALMALHAKGALLELGGYRIAARSFGRIEQEDLTLGERLSFFRGDLAVDLLAIPLALLAVVWLLRGRPRARAAFVATVSVAFAALLFVQLECFYQVGRFVSLGLLRDALT